MKKFWLLACMTGLIFTVTSASAQQTSAKENAEVTVSQDQEQEKNKKGKKGKEGKDWKKGKKGKDWKKGKEGKKKQK